MNVLIVEDESNLADALSHILQESKYHVDCANDGKTGLDWALTNMYDAIVLDIMLPGMDGIEVCRTLRSKGISTPVIILTARSEIRDKVAGLDAGADDYLTKPFDPEELVLRINSCLRRHGCKAQNAEEAIVLGDLEVLPKTRAVTVSGERVLLTPKEFDILCFMAHYPCVVFTRQQILESVWGADHVGDPGIVAVLIRRLREKIEQDPSRPRHLLTEWGAGYRLV